MERKRNPVSWTSQRAIWNPVRVGSLREPWKQMQAHTLLGIFVSHNSTSVRISSMNLYHANLPHKMIATLDNLTKKRRRPSKILGLYLSGYFWVKIRSAVTATDTNSNFSPVTAKTVPEKALKGSFISQQVTYVTPLL